MVKRAGVPLLGLIVVLALTAATVAMLRIPERAPVDDASPSATTPVSPTGGEPEPEAGTDGAPEEVPVVTVVGSGPRVDHVLAGSEFNFFTETGFGVDVVVLASPGLVWNLTEENRNQADVIEVGFRLDALSGSGDDSLLEIDRASIDSLSRVDERFLLDAHGVVPLIDGALGLFVSGEQDLADWFELQSALDNGTTVVLPGPPTDLSVVFVWALGDGDPDRGLERYGELIRGGALAPRTTSGFVDAISSGPAVGAWSSAGVVRARRTVEALEFRIPASGAVALPGFAGILAETEHPEAAHRWLDFRLETILQTAMTFDDVPRQLDQEFPVPPVPVVDVERGTRDVTAFDPHVGDAFMVMDWRAVGASAPDVVAALESMVEPG